MFFLVTLANEENKSSSHHIPTEGLESFLEELAMNSLLGGIRDCTAADDRLQKRIGATP